MLTSPLYLLTLQVALMSQSAAAAGAETPFQHSLHLHLIPCEAPLLPPNANPEHFVTEHYRVHLLLGHTLQKHFEVIQTDLTPYIYHVFDKFYVDRDFYGCRDVDDVLLASIRSAVRPWC